MTKEIMMETKGRFPKKNEWWGPNTEEEWTTEWIKNNPKY
jgi:hypothetical protein